MLSSATPGIRIHKYMKHIYYILSRATPGMCINKYMMYLQTRVLGVICDIYVYTYTSYIRLYIYLSRLKSLRRKSNIYVKHVECMLSRATPGICINIYITSTCI